MFSAHPPAPSKKPPLSLSLFIKIVFWATNEILPLGVEELVTVAFWFLGTNILLLFTLSPTALLFDYNIWT